MTQQFFAGFHVYCVYHTYVSDCISKRVKVNNGERKKTILRTITLPSSTQAPSQESGRKSQGAPASQRQEESVWRCMNRLDYGKKYCHHSPSIEESLLQDAVMRAIMQTAKQNIEVLKTLKIHIGMGLTDEVIEDKTLDIQIRIAEIDAEFQKMLKTVSADNADGIDEERITELMNEKQRLTVQLEQYAAMRQKRESAKSRLDEIFTILDGLQNHPMEYDDTLVRQMIECVVVESKEKIKVVIIGGTEIEMTL